MVAPIGKLVIGELKPASLFQDDSGLWCVIIARPTACALKLLAKFDKCGSLRVCNSTECYIRNTDPHMEVVMTSPGIYSEPQRLSGVLVMNLGEVIEYLGAKS